MCSHWTATWHVGKQADTHTVLGRFPGAYLFSSDLLITGRELGVRASHRRTTLASPCARIHLLPSLRQAHGAGVCVLLV